MIQYIFRLCRNVWVQILVAAELHTSPFKVANHLSCMAIICLNESAVKLNAYFIQSWTHTSIKLQFICKYTGVLVPQKSLCPHWTLVFVFISLPNTVSGTFHGSTGVINMTDAFNFQAGGRERERCIERERRNAAISKSNWSLPTFLHKHRPQGHFASFNRSPSVLFDCACVNLRKILFRQNEDVLDI